MTFEQFQASRTEVADLNAAIGAQYWDKPTPGLLYAGQELHIEKFGSGYVLTIGNCQWEARDLEDLERKLYAFALGEGYFEATTEGGADVTTVSNLRACRWDFDDGPGRYYGLADGTYWNGWLNVFVTPETRAKVAADLRAAGDEETAADLEAIPVEDGLVDFRQGWCIVEVKEKP